MDIDTKLMMKRTKAFSTIEMMVAVALFSMVVVMSIAAMLALVDANQKARSVKTAMDNLGFTLEDMARNLRFGSKYFCETSVTTPIPIPAGSASSTSVVNDCQYGSGAQNTLTGGPYIEFRDHANVRTYYRLSSGCIQKKTAGQWGSVDGSGNYVANGYTDDFTGYSCVTSPDITITDLSFYVYNSQPYDPSNSNTWQQPYVVISVQGTAGSKASTQTSFSIMTSVAQRIPHSIE